MAVFLRRLLGIGALPRDMRTDVENEGVLHLAESVPVTFRFTGSLPGKTSVGNVRSYTGALVLTSRRLLATLSTVPRKAGRSVDQPWSAPAGTMVTARLTPDGLHLELPDLSLVDTRFAGTMSLDYRTPLADEVLMRVPTTTLAFDVPPRYVSSMAGVPLAG